MTVSVWSDGEKRRPSDSIRSSSLNGTEQQIPPCSNLVLVD